MLEILIRPCSTVMPDLFSISNVFSFYFRCPESVFLIFFKLLKNLSSSLLKNCREISFHAPCGKLFQSTVTLCVNGKEEKYC